jgi:hypothetical protein
MGSPEPLPLSLAPILGGVDDLLRTHPFQQAS